VAAVVSVVRDGVGVLDRVLASEHPPPTL